MMIAREVTARSLVQELLHRVTLPHKLNLTTISHFMIKPTSLVSPLSPWLEQTCPLRVQSFQRHYCIKSKTLLNSWVSCLSRLWQSLNLTRSHPPTDHCLRFHPTPPSRSNSQTCHIFWSPRRLATFIRTCTNFGAWQWHFSLLQHTHAIISFPTSMLT